MPPVGHFLPPAATRSPFFPNRSRLPRSPQPESPMRRRQLRPARPSAFLPLQLGIPIPPTPPRSPTCRIVGLPAKGVEADGAPLRQPDSEDASRHSHPPRPALFRDELQVDPSHVVLALLVDEPALFVDADRKTRYFPSGRYAITSKLWPGRWNPYRSIHPSGQPHYRRQHRSGRRRISVSSRAFCAASSSSREWS